MLLNPFPIQFLALIAYALLRLAVAGVLLTLAWRHYRHRTHFVTDLTPRLGKLAQPTVGLFIAGELVIGSFLLFGAYTQWAALALMAMCIDIIVTRRFVTSTLLPPRIFYVLLFFCATSLFITGAGVLAVDLPI
jgi:uncharacterized membrane protein YphA (DoxX/SURF4 family)